VTCGFFVAPGLVGRRRLGDNLGTSSPWDGRDFDMAAVRCRLTHAGQFGLRDRSRAPLALLFRRRPSSRPLIVSPAWSGTHIPGVTVLRDSRRMFQYPPTRSDVVGAKDEAAYLVADPLVGAGGAFEGLQE
jgi:hypothetical protein